MVHTLIPDDTSRCRLSFIPGVEGSDYINANYIDVSHASVDIHHSTPLASYPGPSQIFDVAQEKWESSKFIMCMTLSTD